QPHPTIPAPHHLPPILTFTRVFFFFMLRPPPTSTLFPYTTLFRSAEMQNETQKEIAGIQSATSRQNTKDQVYAQNEMLAYTWSLDRKSGSAGMPRPISYAVFCLKKKKKKKQ